MILFCLNRNGPQSTKELVKDVECDDETILNNCKKLVKQGWIYDKPNKQGKYKLVEESKVPSFLTFQTRNIMFSKRVLNHIFNPISKRQEEEGGFNKIACSIGSYILYVLIETLNEQVPWTARGFNYRDPRKYDKNKEKLLINESWLRELKDSWLRDTIDLNFILEFLTKKYGNDYEKLLDLYESSCPDMYKTTAFHKGITEIRDIKNTKR
jgi:DNA-binding Lrp family transcriptional regulator